MALNFVDRGSGFRGIEMLNGITYEVYPITALCQATGGAIHANLGDDAVQDDLAILAEPLQQLADVGIGENIEGLLFNDDLSIDTQIPREINFTVRDHVMIGQKRP